MSETVRSLGVNVRANTQNFEAGMRKVSLVLRSTVAGLNFVTAAAASQEKSFLAMANAVAIGYASGGPLGLAVAGLGVGIGTIIGKVKEADEEWSKAMASMRSETEKLEKSAQQAADRLFESRGGSIRARELERIIALSDEATKQAESARGRARGSTVGRLEAALFGMENVTEAAGRAKEISDVRGQQRGFAIDDARDYLALTIEQAQWEEKLLGITDDRERKIAEITREAGLQMQQITALVNAGAQLPEGMDIADVMDALTRLRDLRIEQIDLAKPLEKASEAAQLAARSVSDFLSAVIVRGAEARDVLASIAQTLLSVGIQRVVNAAFGVAQP